PARPAARLHPRSARCMAQRLAARARAGLHGRGGTPPVAARRGGRRDVAVVAACRSGRGAGRQPASTAVDGMRKRHEMRTAAIALVAGAAAAAALVAWLNVRGEAPVSDALPAGAADAALVQRGAYLARAGNCAACHTA